MSGLSSFRYKKGEFAKKLYVDHDKEKAALNTNACCSKWILWISLLLVITFLIGFEMGSISTFSPISKFFLHSNYSSASFIRGEGNTNEDGVLNTIKSDVKRDYNAVSNPEAFHQDNRNMIPESINYNEERLISKNQAPINFATVSKKVFLEGELNRWKDAVTVAKNQSNSS